MDSTANVKTRVLALASSLVSDSTINPAKLGEAYRRALADFMRHTDWERESVTVESTSASLAGTVYLHQLPPRTTVHSVILADGALDHSWVPDPKGIRVCAAEATIEYSNNALSKFTRMQESALLWLLVKYLLDVITKDEDLSDLATALSAYYLLEAVFIDDSQQYGHRYAQATTAYRGSLRGSVSGSQSSLNRGVYSTRLKGY